ncbi:MAG TPA: SMI1/KNR4 family protein [Kofleriaceae bacterium]|jgi:cell wall assembly regulator SMI1
MQAVVSRLEAWLAGQEPALLETLPPGATADELADAESQIGATFPQALRAIFLWRNGAALCGARTLLSLADVTRLRDELQASVSANAFPNRDWWHRAWIPFATDGKGNYLVWDPGGSFEGERGQVLEYWHAEQERTVLAPSVDDYLTALADTLESGAWTRDEDGALSDGGQLEELISSRFPGFPYDPINRDGRRAKTKKRTSRRADKPHVAPNMALPVRAYKASEKFSPGDRVTHPQFGEGVVEVLSEPTKITVWFESGRKVLVHNGKPAPGALTRPQPFDHTFVRGSTGGTKPPGE